MNGTAAAGAIIGALFAASFRAQAPGPGTTATATAGEAFRDRLVRALDTNSRGHVAAMFRYPIRVLVPIIPLPIPVDTAASMVQMYDLFFTPEMRCAIEGSRVPRAGAPRPKYPLLVADGVVSLADGRVIAERTPRGLLITRLTVTGHGGPPGGRRETVRFHWGDGETQFAGRLSGNGVDTYTMAVRQGDLVQARIERFPGRSLQLRVTEAKTGRAVDGATGEFARTWAARAPETGDYHIAVVRRGAYCDPSVTYLLTVGLRRRS